MNEIERMQELANVANKADIKLKKLLKVNSHESLYNSIINISASDANKVALGMELIFNNFDCAPNGGVISNVIEYLRQK
jgi:plasmid replication initiation protein